MSTRTASIPLAAASSRPPSAAALVRPNQPERRPSDRNSPSHRPELAGTSLRAADRRVGPAPRFLVAVFTAFVAGHLAACVASESNPGTSRQGSARFLVAAGDSALENGRLEDARRRYEEALSLASRTSEKAEAILALNQLGVLDERQGALEDAAHHYQQAIELQQVAGEGPGEALLRTNLAGVLSATGHDAQAEAQIARAIELSRPDSEPQTAAAAYSCRGRIHERAGRFTDAAGDFGTAAVLYGRAGSASDEAAARWMYGRVLLAAGDTRHAIPELSRAQEGILRLPRPKQDPRIRLSALQLLAQCFDRIGQPKNALTFRERAVELARTAGDAAARRSVLDEAIAAADALGRTDLASAWRREAAALD
jgi:tetratricopeptide (TPR) repeat protein